MLQKGCRFKDTYTTVEVGSRLRDKHIQIRRDPWSGNIWWALTSFWRPLLDTDPTYPNGYPRAFSYLFSLFRVTWLDIQKMYLKIRLGYILSQVWISIDSYISPSKMYVLLLSFYRILSRYWVKYCGSKSGSVSLPWRRIPKIVDHLPRWIWIWKIQFVAV